MERIKLLKDCYDFVCSIKRDDDCWELTFDIKTMFYKSQNQTEHQANHFAALMQYKYEFRLKELSEIKEYDIIRPQVPSFGMTMPVLKDQDGMTTLEDMIKLLIKTVYEKYWMNESLSRGIDFGQKIETFMDTIKDIAKTTKRSREF